MSVSTTHLILFIASIAVAASVAGAVTTEASRLSGTLDDVGIDLADEVDTDIEIVTDAGAGVYDADQDTLRLHVQNLGERTLPHDADQIDVFVDGAYQPVSNRTVTTLGGSSWAPDTVVRLDVAVADLAWGDHRVKVVVDGDAEVLAFRNCAGIARDSVVYEQNANKELAFIDRTGVVTQLGVPTVGFGAVMADFDCDGRLEAPYIDQGDGTINIVDHTGDVQQLTSSSVAVIDRRLGVGDLDGDGNPAVIYPNGSDNNYLYRVEHGEPPERIGAGFMARSIGGVADFNGDGDLDVVYLGTNDKVLYLDDGTAIDTAVKARDALGIGGPMDFDGDGEVRVPIRSQTSNLVQLVDSDGNTQIILSIYTDSTGALGSFDWNDDGTPDVITSNQGDGRKIYYLELDGTNTAVQDQNGNPVPTSPLGVA